MKKSLLLAASVLLAGTAMAQDLELTVRMGNNILESGKSYWYNNIHSEDMGGYYEVKIKPNLYISCNEDLIGMLNIMATCTSGQLINLCSGGQCVTGTTVNKPNLTLAADSELDIDMYWEGEVDDLDEVPTGISVDLKTWISDEPSTEKTFKIVMNDPTNSVKILAADKEVYLSGNALHYNITSSAMIYIYDVKGNIMLNAPVNGTGAVDLTTLPKGVYLYNIKGATPISGKIVK